MTDTRARLLTFVAGGLVGGTAGIGAAQPYLVNISGATLMENVIRAPASTNDFIDVDGNGVAGSLGTGPAQQLAPFGLPPGTTPGQHWIVQYRVVGSVNGFQELVDFGQTFVNTPDNTDIFSLDATKAFHNRTQYINNGVGSNPIFNALNPGGAPVRSLTDGSYTATSGTDPATTGLQIDIAILDVPSRWAVRQDGSAPSHQANPGQPGYGTNPRLTVNKDGTVNGFNYLLADLGGLNLFDPNNAGAADGNTIFDTPIAFAPVATLTNLGTGLTQIDMSDLRHLALTGRRLNGENLMMITRDAGSGTHNAWMNSIAIDPSFGVGENIGGLSTLNDLNLLGPDFQPGNKGGSSGLEATLINHRLGIGYTGAERAVNSGLVTNGRMELLAVRNDLYGGAEYSRPNIDEILDNTANGYVIGGPGTFSTIGDPRSAPVALGGDGGNTHPDMRNPQAAAYINNTTRSISAFISVPGGDETLFMPGEYIALQLILTDALDFVQNPTDPTDLVPNAGLNQALQDFIRDNSVLANPVYYTFGTVSLNGKVPTRKTGVTYSDAVANGQNYVDQSGAIVTYGQNLADRNRIAGDFNGDGLRNINDAAEMVAAWRQRNGGPAWTAPSGTGTIAGAPGSTAVIEILGDFDGDGSFTAADVRYWADGLATDAAGGLLNRKAGFVAVDNAFGGNFFGTTIAGGRPYTAGDSRADIIGASGNITRGFAPTGADGVVDQSDLDYVIAQYTGNPAVTDGEATWSDPAEALAIDLSADINGDLVVNEADADEVRQILGLGCPADFDGSGTLTLADFVAFRNAYVAGDLAADFDNSGTLTLADFVAFRNAYVAGCP